MPASIRRQGLLMSVVMFALVASIQAYWLQGTFERDQSVYSVIAQELLKGRPLYSDLWDHKPPAIHGAYVLALICTGNSMISLWLMGTILGFTTGVGLLLLVRRITDSVAAQITALLLWLILFCSPNLESTQPNTEAFINACWVWSAVLLGSVNVRRFEWLLGSCLVGIATLFKPIAIVLFLPVFLLCAHQGEWRIRRIVSAGALMSGFPILLWLTTYGYFWATERAHAFLLAVVTYNQAYAGDIGANIRSLFSIRRLFPTGIAGLYIPLLLSVAMIVYNLVHPKARLSGGFHLAVLVAAYVAIALPGNYYLHYYQYLLPPLVVMSSALVAQLRARWTMLASLVILAAALFPEALTAIFPQRFHRAPLYTDSPRVDALTVAQLLRSQLAPGEWFYEFGAQPALYLETGISPRHGALHISWLIEGPAAQVLTAQTLEVLERDPPALVVISLLFIDSVPADHPVIVWIKNHYEVSGAGSRFFMVLRRKKMLV